MATTTQSVFDLASLSKIFTTLLIMRASNLSPQDSLHKFFKDAPMDLRVEDLMRHRAGLPAGLAASTIPKDNSALVSKIISLLKPQESTFLYSDLDFILLASILAQTQSENLVSQYGKLFEQLKLNSTFHFTNYNKKKTAHFVGSEALKNKEKVEPQDPTAKLIPNLAGHAGVFSSLNNLCSMLKQVFGDRTVLNEALLAQMVEIDTNGRALGWDHSSSFADNLRVDLVAPKDHLGHTGYTGTSISIHLAKRYFVVLLTNRTFGDFDENQSGLAIQELRKSVHTLVHSQL